MFDNQLLGNRLKLLRTTHNLKLAEVADLSGNLEDSSDKTQINISSLSQWENGTAVMRISFAQRLADIYGISLDWLTGRSDNPYSIDNLITLEKEVFPLIINIDGKEIDITKSLTGIPSEYKKPKKRSFYPPEVRANIIFMLNLLRHNVITQKGNISYNEKDDVYTLEPSNYDEDIKIKLFQLWVINPKKALFKLL